MSTRIKKITAMSEFCMKPPPLLPKGYELVPPDVPGQPSCDNNMQVPSTQKNSKRTNIFCSTQDFLHDHAC